MMLAILYSNFTKKHKTKCIYCLDCFEYEKYYSGNDLDHVSSYSAEECQRECQKLSKCMFWTWLSKVNVCIRKTSKPDSFIDYNIAKSGPKFCSEYLHLNYQS